MCDGFLYAKRAEPWTDVGEWGRGKRKRNKVELREGEREYKYLCKMYADRLGNTQWLDVGCLVFPCLSSLTSLKDRSKKINFCILSTSLTTFFFIFRKSCRYLFQI